VLPVIAEGSGHQVHIEAPVVVQAIRDVVAQKTTGVKEVERAKNSPRVEGD